MRLKQGYPNVPVEACLACAGRPGEVADAQGGADGESAHASTQGMPLRVNAAAKDGFCRLVRITMSSYWQSPHEGISASHWLSIFTSSEHCLFSSLTWAQICCAASIRLICASKPSGRSDEDRDIWGNFPYVVWGCPSRKLRGCLVVSADDLAHEWMELRVVFS